MFRYQDSEIQKDRLNKGECRCASQGAIYDLPALLKNGRISDPVAGNTNLSTRPVRTPGLGLAGTGDGVAFIFAVDEEFRIRIAADGVRTTQGSIKHETLFHNADVRAAGEICISDGVVAGLNDQSGSYHSLGKLETDPAFADAVLKALNDNNLPVNDMLRAQLENRRIV